MVETKCRFKELLEKRIQVKENGVPREGMQFIIFENRFGYKKISCILNYKNGYLHSTPDTPAVQFEDTHTEYWTDGVLSNVQLDSYGHQMPAIFSDYGETKEWWINGKRTK